MEELETSKEELQSMNEELQTINQENRHKVEELSLLTDDLSNLISATDIATLFLDRELRILRVTPQVTELFNVRGNDRGRSLTDFSNRLGYDHLEEDARQVLERLTSVKREVKSQTGNWYIMRLLPYLAGDHIKGLVITFVDITEHKNMELSLRESEERFRVLVESASQAVWETDAAGVAVKDSPSWRAYTGQTLNELLGYGWVNAIHPEDQEYAERQWREAVAACREVNAEFRLQGPDGTWRWTNVRAAPVRDAAGQIYKWVGMNIDITDRKQAEGALQEADQRKDEFLATLAHELRNPLVPLRSGLDALKLSNDKPEDIAQIRTMMERQLNHMIRLIDDLLDISRINRGKMDLKLENNINLNNILQTAVESVQPLIQEAGQEFTIKMTDEPLYVKADPVRLTQVFSNLLNNATKFTPEGGHIQLNIECKAKEVLVRVRDNGSGIASDMLPQIFDLFMQADQTTKVKHSGLGIGLTLVKRLVGMHGGTVEARSDGPGLGSEFIVRLPSTNEAMPVEQDDRDEKVLRDSDARRILIVDDEPDVLHSLNMLLNIMGNVTRIADNGMADHLISTILR